MTRSLKTLVAVLSSALLALPAWSTQKAYEGFDYPSGTSMEAISDTGTGWNSAWVSSNVAGSLMTETVKSPGMSYQSGGNQLVVTGNCMSLVQNYSTYRTLTPPMTASTYWMSFLGNVSQGFANATSEPMELNFFDGDIATSTNRRFTWKRKTGTTGWEVTVPKSGGNPDYSDSTGSGNVTPGTFFYAMKFQNRTSGCNVHLWINPALNGVEPVTGVGNYKLFTTDSTYSTAGITFDRISLYGSGNSSETDNRLDEFRLGDDWADVAPLLTATLSANAQTAYEQSAARGGFYISLNGNAVTDTLIYYAVSGNAESGNDYTALPGNVVIPAGHSGNTVTIVPVDDSLVEGGYDVVTLTLTGASGYVVGSPYTDSVLIYDNDMRSVEVSALDPIATESGNTTGTYKITLSANAVEDLSINYTMSGSAGNGVDYSALAGSLAIATNAISGNITLTPMYDTILEGTENAILTLTGGTNYTLGSNVSAAIYVEDDETTNASISANVSSLAEGGNCLFTVTLTQSSNNAIAMLYTIGGTAASASDFMSLSGNLTIAANTTSGNISLATVNDTVPEDSETVILTLYTYSANVYSPSGTSSATVSITDNDTAVVNISASDSMAAELGTDPGVLVISRNYNTSTLTVGFTLSGTATAGSDYTSVSNTISLPVGGDSSKAVIIVPVDDSTAEGSETVIASLEAGSGYSKGSSTQATVTISDNDVPATPSVTVAASDASASEVGLDQGVFTVTRTLSTASAINVTFTIGGNATSATDYTAIGGNVLLPASVASANVIVSPLADNDSEGTEDVTLTLSAPADAYTLGSTTSATVTIADNPLAAAATAAAAASGGGGGCMLR